MSDEDITDRLRACNAPQEIARLLRDAAAEIEILRADSRGIRKVIDDDGASQAALLAEIRRLRGVVDDYVRISAASSREINALRESGKQLIGVSLNKEGDSHEEGK